jgi:hypothetical protein
MKVLDANILRSIHANDSRSILPVGAQFTASDQWKPTSPATASFSITRIASVGGSGREDLVAPFGAFFRATDLSGFSVLDDAADGEYDPSQHRITFVWNFGDRDYTPLISPNIPSQWQDTNLAFGRQVAHVWNSPGRYVVSCVAIDDSGAWGKATFDIVVEDPNRFYARNSTFCVSQSGNFAGAPAGSQKFRSMEEARSAIQAYTRTTRDRARLLVRAGETFVNTPAFDFGSGDFRENLKSFQTGTFGGKDRTRFTVDSAAHGLRYMAPANRYTRRFAIVDIDFQGPWDSATETGPVVGVASTITSRSPILVHRCRFNGFSELSFEHLEDEQTSFILSDSEVTNWANYGIAFTPARMAVIGCDIHQHADALGGVNQGVGDQRPFELGNRHGPFRGGGSQFFCSATSWFSRNGWSASGTTDYSQVPPTVEQVPVRFDSTNTLHGMHVFERCSMEGGWSAIWPEFWNGRDGSKWFEEFPA